MDGNVKVIDNACVDCCHYTHRGHWRQCLKDTHERVGVNEITGVAIYKDPTSCSQARQVCKGEWFVKYEPIKVIEKEKTFFRKVM